MPTLTTQGDPLLVPGASGLDLEVTGGVVTLSEGLENSVYLSLFGGNIDDDGRAGNRMEWWGNHCLQGNQRLRSETQFLLCREGVLSSSTRKQVEAAVLRDLKWMLDAKMVDEIDARCVIEGADRAHLYVALSLGGKTRVLEYVSDEALRVRMAQQVEQITRFVPPDIPTWTPALYGLTLEAGYDPTFGVTLDSSSLVQAWAPRWGNPLHILSQSTAANRPSVVLEDDGKTAINLDGVNDCLYSLTLGAALSSSTYAIVIECTVPQVNNARLLTVTNDSGTERLIDLYQGSVDTGYLVNQYFKAGVSDTAPGQNGIGTERQVIILERNGTTSRIITKMGTLSTTLSASGNACTKLFLGAFLGASCGGMRVTGLWVYSSALSDAAGAYAKMRELYPDNPPDPTFGNSWTPLYQLRADQRVISSQTLVSAWDRKAPLSSFVQASSTYQPVLAMGTKRKYVDFSGTKGLLCASPIGNGSSYSYSIQDVVLKDAGVNGYVTPYTPIGVRPAGSFTRIYVNGGSYDVPVNALGMNWYRVVFDGSQAAGSRVQIYLNGVLQTPTISGSTASVVAVGPNATIGALWDGQAFSSPFTGRVYEINTWVSNAAMANDLAAAIAYYRTLYASEGLTLP